MLINGIACPEDDGPLKMPGLVTDESKLYETVAFPPPGFVLTPVTVSYTHLTLPTILRV